MTFEICFFLLIVFNKCFFNIFNPTVKILKRHLL
jgi:hypothetical protein